MKCVLFTEIRLDPFGESFSSMRIEVEISMTINWDGHIAASFVINLSSPVHGCTILSLKVRRGFSNMIVRKLLHDHF